jgi:hypothetical protein
MANGMKSGSGEDPFEDIGSDDDSKPEEEEVNLLTPRWKQNVELAHVEKAPETVEGQLAYLGNIPAKT